MGTLFVALVAIIFLAAIVGSVEDRYYEEFMSHRWEPPEDKEQE